MTESEFGEAVNQRVDCPREFIARAITNIGDALEGVTETMLDDLSGPLTPIMNLSAWETQLFQAEKIPSADFLKMPPSPMALFLRGRM